MSAFEDFIQLELPLRPYVLTDPPQESVLIRRGLGPRQLQPVEINVGEVLGNVGGVVQSVPGAAGAVIQTFTFDQTASAIVQWDINHAKNSNRAIVQIYDTSNKSVYPDNTTIVDSNNITIDFSSPQAGTAFLIFLD